MTTIRYTLDNKDITAPQLAKWVMERAHSKFTSKDGLDIARSLIRGEVWEVPAWMLSERVLYEREKHGPCSYTIIEDPPSALDLHFARQETLQKLCERGAARDAGCAIEYCKAMLAGEVNMSACAG